ncbi:BET1 homolog [Parasteatoda tepidariorum]|uniref:BET1 homolog n=2 Tax=Parasteatoda tepidariorum TaxID=114398 RepID=A0A2L2Y9M6_PARTP|nr:BET1 homolog [Parasteatoda tepidariorum]
MRRSHTNDSYAPYNRNTVEDENEQLVDGLQNKITALKSLTIDIGHEVRNQNQMLREMDDDFDSTSGFLSTTMGRVVKLAKSGHNRYILYLLLFSFFVFFMIYLIMKFQ